MFLTWHIIEYGSEIMISDYVRFPQRAAQGRLWVSSECVVLFKMTIQTLGTAQILDALYVLERLQQFVLTVIV